MCLCLRRLLEGAKTRLTTKAALAMEITLILKQKNARRMVKDHARAFSVFCFRARQQISLILEELQLFPSLL